MLAKRNNITTDALLFILKNLKNEDIEIRIAFDNKLKLLQVDILGEEVLYSNDTIIFSKHISETEYFYGFNELNLKVLKKCLAELKISYSIFYI